MPPPPPPEEEEERGNAGCAEEERGKRSTGRARLRLFGEWHPRLLLLLDPPGNEAAEREGGRRRGRGT